MRVLTTIFVAFAEQNNHQESAIDSVEDSFQAINLPIELVGIYQGKNRVIAIEQSEEE